MNESICQPLINLFIYNAETTVHQVVWDTMEAFLRVLLIQAISRFKKSGVKCETILAADNLIWKDIQLLYKRTTLEKAEQAHFFTEQVL